jgi:hypothetical protein
MIMINGRKWMTEFNTKSVYIPSLEASDIYSHMFRDTSINHDYCGMIPFSLELIKLRKEGLKSKTDSTS